MKALTAHDSTTDDPLACAFNIAAPTTATDAFMFMPGGLHTITPSQGGKPVTVSVMVGPDSAAALNQQLSAVHSATRKKVYFDFDHSDGKASFWPTGFEWRTSPEPGVYALGEWTGSGKAAIEGKDYRGFSPVFHVDDVRGKPARIICQAKAKPNMGGLVNDPAFSAIKPFFAHDAHENADAVSNANNQENTAHMTPAELAALQAKIQSLEQDITGLKAKDTAEAAAELRAKQAELKTAQAEIARDAAEKQAGELKAKNEKLEADDLARRQAHGKKFAADMVARGAIAAKDTAVIAEVEKNVTENPTTFEPIYAKWAGNPALTAGRVTQPATRPATNVVVLANSGLEILGAYAALVAQNAAIRDVNSVDKRRISQEMAALFASDMSGNEAAWMGVPLDRALQAADVTSAAVGTLAGTLVLQRSLPLMKFQYPMLQTLFTDFSDAVGLWQQTEMTRIPISPAVTEYDATLDANGRPKGFVVVTPGQSVDIPITLSKHVGIPMIFGVQTLASTVRNLFGEQSEAAINALGGYFVNMATALMTAANFNAYKQITDAGCETTSGSTAIVLATTAGVYPGQEISGTGIPTGTVIASVTDATHAVMTQAATATATVTATLGGGKVPTLYPTFVKALADFNFASLGEIGAAFDNNRVPFAGRYAMLNASYYQKLAQDPNFNTFFAAIRNPEIINKGILPELNGFLPQKAPYFPSSSNRVGFAYHQAAIALKARLPQDFTKAVSAMVPGSVTTVTDPDTKLSVLHVERVDLTGSYAESRIEVMLGAAVGDRRAGMVMTSA